MGIIRAGIAGLAVALALQAPLPAVAAATQYDSTLRDRFQLYSECQPVATLIEPLGRETANTGLTYEGLQAATKLRLQLAGLYSESRLSGPTLYVRVYVYRDAFSVMLALMKRVWEPVADLSAAAATWDSYKLGIHGGDTGYVRDTLVRSMDEFVAAYLQANESSCQ